MSKRIIIVYKLYFCDAKPLDLHWIIINDFLREEKKKANYEKFIKCIIEK